MLIVILNLVVVLNLVGPVGVYTHTCGCRSTTAVYTAVVLEYRSSKFACGLPCYVLAVHRNQNQNHSY